MKNDMRLIDTNALMLEPDEHNVMNGIQFKGRRAGKTIAMVQNALKLMINSAPAVDAAPVVHSSWAYRLYRKDMRITTSGEVVCRDCHAPFFRVRGMWYKYCPNCGAKMDATDNNVGHKDGGNQDGE